MIGDFTKFFDMLDHDYLKGQWCSLLQVERLPKDHYAVFKEKGDLKTCSLLEMVSIVKFVIEILENPLTKP